MKLHLIVVFVLIFAATAGIAPAQAGKEGQVAQRPAPEPALVTPASIRTEHEHLHHQLERAMASGGKTAASAKALAAVLMPHFQMEEKFAMPPLGLLPALAQSQPLTGAQIRQAMEMSKQLRTNYDLMIREHRQIESALESLASAARQEHKAEALAFAQALKLHAQNEEQVLYPTTLLIGRYLALSQTAGQGSVSGKLPPPAKP